MNNVFLMQIVDPLNYFLCDKPELTELPGITCFVHDIVCFTSFLALLLFLVLSRSEITAGFHPPA